MKKFAIVFSIILIILLMITTTFAKTGKVNTSSLNVRSDASTSASVIGGLASRTKR